MVRDKLKLSLRAVDLFASAKINRHQYNTHTFTIELRETLFLCSILIASFDVGETSQIV